MNDKLEVQPEAELLEILITASKQYERYMELAAATKTLAQEENFAEPQKRADWTHPVGIAFGS